MKKLLIIGAFFMGSLFSSFASEGINTNKGKPTFVPDELIVKFDRSVTKQHKNSLKIKYNMALKKNSKKSGAFTVFKHGNPTAIMNRLKNEPGVISVEQNAYAYMSSIPNDPYYDPYQWHMTRIGCEAAWDMSTGSGAVVAIIDTGVKQTLEDLGDTQFTSGWDFVNSDNDPKDDEGHGSHVAGTIAQTTNNGIGCVGVAYNCTIMPIKVLNKRGSGTYDDIADGIYYAADNGAHIINMSLGGTSSLAILEDAVNYAWNHGVVVVCAAGNDNTDALHYPSAYENAISVSATTSLDTLASYSNYGSTIDICAPGGDSGDNNGDGYDDMILQNTFVRNSEGYYFFAGTSMASPHVAGVAALVKSKNPSLTNTQIRNILESTAYDINHDGWDEEFGYGLVNAYDAVQSAGGSPVNDAPVASFTYSISDLNVNFTDTSTDSDGSVVSWSWDFGDGNSSTEQNPSHTYTSTGTYTVVLTSTDNDGAFDSTSQNITVSSPTQNEAPVGDFTYLASDLNVVFTDTSYDSDGSVVSWLWDFGDGNSSTAQNPSHTFSSVGTYTVSLTVTDNDGDTDTISKDIAVSTSTGGTFHVVSINMSTVSRGKNTAGVAVIYFEDGGGYPVANATVYIAWDGSVTGSDSGITGADGTVTFTSPNTKDSNPTFNITVTDATHSSLTFE